MDLSSYNDNDFQQGLLVCQLYSRWLNNLAKANQPIPTYEKKLETLRTLSGQDDKTYQLALYLLQMSPVVVP